MITRLSLEGFGRFRRAVFDLSPVTLVYGPNEAGKTTFFDGLFQAICRPSETKKAGRLLKERYGPGRKAEAVSVDADAGPVSDDEFLNLYAIRAGDLRLEMSPGSDWLERLKARLFLGGVDPAVLAAEFEKRSSDSRTLIHNKELDRVREEAAKAVQDLDSRRRERDSLLAREGSLADAEAGLREIRGLRVTARDEVREVEAALASEEKTALRRRLSDQLGLLEEWEGMEAEAGNPDACGEESREEWNRLADRTRSASEAVQAERGRREALGETAERARLEWRALRDSMDAAAAASVSAGRLAEEARAHLARKTGPLDLPAWSAALSLALLALGSTGGQLLSGVFAAGAAALALISAGAAFFLGRRQVRIRERGRAARALARWKAQWKLESQDVPGMMHAAGENDSAAGFLQMLEAWDRERKGLEIREAEARRRLEAISGALEKSDAVMAALREEEDDRRRLERAWLSRHGVASPEEFLLKVSRRRQVLAELPGRRRDLESVAPGGDLAAFRRDLVRRLRGLDEEGVATRGIDEAGMQRLRFRRQELLANLEELGLREREMIASREGLAGEIRGALGKMAAEIVECEDRLASAEARIKAMELDKKAAALAMEIFRGLGDGADSLLADLSTEIGSLLALILPPDRVLSIPGLESRRIRAMDAGGEIRSIEHLSTGTKDAVVLAAKLALALKHRGRAGILVLDDPFIAMDEERETRALLLLREFHSRHAWQIILLTKDARLRDKVLALFPNPSLVDLVAFA